MDRHQEATRCVGIHTPLVDILLTHACPLSSKQVADDVIDMNVFQQILELDEDEDEDDDSDPFSKEMAYDYFSQAEKTFTDMADALCA